MEKKVFSSAVQEIARHFERGAMPSEFAEIPFAEGIWPWIGAARARIADSTLSLLEPKALFAMERALLSRWSGYCAPSMALELGVCRMAGELDGDSREERYADFIRQRFLDKEALFAFFDEYAELSRMVGVFLDLWSAQALEFLQRLAGDLPLLADFFNEGHPLGKVVSLDPSAGDLHNGGRSVYILEFECGKKLVYKPKDLRIVAAFHALLEELPLTPGLKGYQVLAKGEYGWEECVEQKACADLSEVSRYFERSGMLLCLMYLLDGSDVHYENLIASGEFPFLIDLETLFHAELSDSHLDHFVLKTGMLPIFLIGDLGKPGVDISALGAEAGQLVSSKQPRWEGVGTDEMRLVYEAVSTREGKQAVWYLGKQLFSKDYVEQIVLGFRKMYACIQEHRAQLVQGTLLSMASLPVRFILRHTRLYARLLQRLCDPQVILNHDLLEQELGILPKYLIEKGKEHLIALVKAEQRALLQGDVPFFTTLPSQTHLFAEGKIVLANALNKPSFEVVMKRIEAMSDADAALQESYIRHSFLIKSSSVHGGGSEKKPLTAPLPISEERRMQEILNIAETLKRRSFYLNKENLTWIAMEGDPLTEQFALQPISDNIYGGRMGIALFFAALAHTTCDLRWRHLALSSLCDVRQKIREGLGKRLIAQMGLGGFTGVGSLIYGLARCAELLDEPALIEEAKVLIQAIEERHILEDRMYDVVGGSAGLLLALLSYDFSALKLATLCGEHLCKSATKIAGGVGWINKNQTALLGFSHGAAGISYALFKLAHITQNQRCLETARLAMEYERSLFNPVKKNWPHLGSTPPAYPTSWCHGATGIGLGRLASSAFYKEPKMEEEIAIALEMTKANLHAGDSPNLCCSTLGRIEFLKEAGQEFDQAIPGLFSEFYNPGFMQGAAGLGYTLLRLQDRTGALPQVLLLSGNDFFN